MHWLTSFAAVFLLMLNPLALATIEITESPDSAPTTLYPTYSPTTVYENCRTAELTRTTAPQTRILTWEENGFIGGMPCYAAHNDIQMVNFKPPKTAYYYVRVMDSVDKIPLSIAVRRNYCDSSSNNVGCTQDVIEESKPDSVGFNMIALTKDKNYVIFVGSRNMTQKAADGNVLEVGEVTDTSLQLTDKYCSLNYMPAPQYSILNVVRGMYFDKQFTHEHNPTCDASTSNVTRAHFINFRANFGGQYFFKVVTELNVTLQLNRGTCGQGDYGSFTKLCNTTNMGTELMVAGTGKRVVGFNQVMVWSSEDYSILISPYNTGEEDTDLTKVLLRIGYCGDNCTAEFGTGDDVEIVTYSYKEPSEFDKMIAGNTAMIVVPIVLFFLALAASLFICQRNSAVVVGGHGVPNESYVKVRKWACATWILSMLVWFSNWGTIWSVAAYVFTVGMFLFAMYTYYLFGGSQVAGSALVKHATTIKQAMYCVAAVLVLHAVVAIAQTGIFATDSGYLCAFYSDDVDACNQYFSPWIAFGTIAMFAMLATAACSVVFVQKFEEVANAIKNGQYPPNTTIAAVEDAEQK